MKHTIIIILSILFLTTACNNKNRNAQSSTNQIIEDEFTAKGEIEVPVDYGSISGFSEATLLPSDGDVDVIAFGSCNKHDLPQPLWGPIMQNKPDAWIWLGDAIYGDSEDPAVLKSKYDAVNANKGYQKLKSMSTVIGTWDDHDYGVNDGNKFFPAKEESKAEFLDFAGVSNSHATCKRAGIYQSYVMGEGSRKIKIILLDARTFRDKVVRDSKKAYIPDPDADILGEDQWKWLASELKNNDAAITIVANGTQVISTSHPYEKWANYPMSRKKLFKIISTFRKSGVVLLSGDRHHGEFSSVKIPELKHPLYEFTSSGLTHTRKYPQPEANKYRVGKKVDLLNFGVLRVDWASNPIKVKLEIRGEMNKLLESCEFDVTK